MAKTVKIVPVLEDGKLVYPATITNAVVDPKTKKTLAQLLDEGFAVIVDEDLDEESVHPVQNKTVTGVLNSKAGKIEDVQPIKNKVDEMEEVVANLDDLTTDDIMLICQ